MDCIIEDKYCAAMGLLENDCGENILLSWTSALEDLTKTQGKYETNLRFFTVSVGGGVAIAS